MSQVFHEIEKRIIASLRQSPVQGPDSIAESAGLSADQTRRGVEWLKLKGIVSVRESSTELVSLGRNGLEALEGGLPERQLLEMLRDGPQSMPRLQKGLGGLFGPAMGLARRRGWILSDSGTIRLAGKMPEIPGEKAIRQIGRGRIKRDAVSPPELEALLGRPDFVTGHTIKTREVSLLPAAESIDLSESGAIDVEADVPRTFVARTHPLKDIIAEIREIFVTLGFTEVTGDMAQSGFWNFDALFTPQDHPAREMQDTFYLDGLSSKKPATPGQVRNVSSMHEKSWRYRWRLSEAQKMVLRTHTTCVTIRHLAENLPEEARIFSLGRVFRNEKTSYKHLVEFNQVEGVVAGKNTTLRDLMGIQKEFYRRMGITRVKFWPTFFPYTEPSLQTMVYNDRLQKWVELFGMGIFRPEVTRPLGIRRPVLAWGGGIERIAMLRYGIDDVREFYSNNLGWLRNASKCL